MRIKKNKKITSHLLILSFCFMASTAKAHDCSADPSVCALARKIMSSVQNNGPITKDPIRKKHIECGETHTDTRGMEFCSEKAIEEYKTALDTVYAAALDSVDEDTQASLRNSQEQWTKFFKSETDTKRQSQSISQGTIISLLLMNEEEQLLRQRIAQLDFYLEWGVKDDAEEK